VIDGAGRPILCSFALARQAGSLLDPDHIERTADDVAALGALLDQVLREAGATTGLRLVSRHRRRALERLVERSTGDAPERRPSARAFAATIAGAIPEASLDGPPPTEAAPGAPRPLATIAPSGPPPSFDLRDLDRLRPPDDAVVEPPRPRLSLVARSAIAVGLVVTVVAVVATRQRPGPTGDATAGPSLVSPTTTASTPPPHTAATRAPDPPPTVATPPATSPAARPAGAAPDPSCPAGALDAADARFDLDGDGCAEAVRVDGNRITAGDRRWVLGEPGDEIAVADWDCDGQPTPAVLRPASGQVFIFDDWAPRHATIAARLVGTVPGAAAFGPRHDGCPPLVVVGPNGTPTSIPVEAP
jgi:hypothetical protein